MNIKTTSRYLMRDMLTSVVWFYGIMLAIYILGYLAIAIGGINGSISGMEFASIIFLFVLGLNSFRENFGMLLQNGVSRKTMFVCRMLTFGAVALLVAVINLALGAIIGALPASNAQLELSFFGTSFYFSAYGVSGAAGTLLSLLFSFSLLFMVLTLGYCITTLFYRLSPIGKAILATSVPIGLSIVLPLVDHYFFGDNISRIIGRFIVFAFGLNGGSPWMPVITFFMASALFAFFGWLLTRRATVKR